MEGRRKGEGEKPVETPLRKGAWGPHFPGRSCPAATLPSPLALPLTTRGVMVVWDVVPSCFLASCSGHYGAVERKSHSTRSTRSSAAQQRAVFPLHLEEEEVIE